MKPSIMRSAFLAVLFIQLLITINISFCSGRTSHVGCIDTERQALSRLKKDLHDPSNVLATWIGDGDCCTWVGVVCHNSTDHVIRLELGYFSDLGGKINPSLIDLKHLIHLDLSNVNLSDDSDWLLNINSLPSLRVLKLSSCQLQHFPPIPFANFSSLTTLDLYNNKFDNSFIPSWVFGLKDLIYLHLSRNNFRSPIPEGSGNFSSLRHLDLSDNFFNSWMPNWWSRLNRLEYLSLRNNNLQGSIPSLLGNLTSLTDLDLSSNMLEGTIPKSFGRLCNLRSISISDGKLSSNMSEVLDIFSTCVSARLESLDFSNNRVSGHLTDQLGQFKKLETLVLSKNSISSLLPSSLGELSSLKTVDLSLNKLKGPIPSSLGELSWLDFVDLSTNKLNGTLSEIHFVNLTRLRHFDLSENPLTLKVSSDWIPLFQLDTLILRSCHVGPNFPSWLHSQKSLNYLVISDAQISDVIPIWFWRSLSQFIYLDLSHNQIHGEIPHLTDRKDILKLDLSSNKLSGPLPPIPVGVNHLILSDNSLSGSISQFLCLGRNESKKTEILDLENNFFSGELPDCWMNWPYLLVLNLGNNEFTGRLPTSMGILGYLQALILRKNSLSGVLPAVSFENCTNLEAINAAENKFSGNVPTWIGERFPSMRILNLRSNKFHGHLPTGLCQLSALQILDIAYNNLSGNIPSCISNFNAMVTVNHSLDTYITYIFKFVYYYLDAELLKGGKEYEYKSTLNLVRAIDLSKNNFSGEIPREVTNLVELWSLNLSHNSLSGTIPENIGAVRAIESIDFSSNQLSGEIPQSISNLAFLSYLNLADNNLTGKIPMGTQIQGFNTSYFTGNHLCGPPLPDCTESSETPEPINGGGKDDKEHEVDYWLYGSLALGFVMGFWGLIGPLLVNRRWRYMYCAFLDRLGDKVYFVARKCY